MVNESSSGLKRAAIVARFELRRAFAGPFGLLAAALFVAFHTWTIRTAVVAAREGTSMDAVGAGIVGWLTGLDGSTVSSAFANHPPVMLVFFLLALLGTPILAVLASCDQLSSDVGSHHVRFLLVRTARGPLFAGKALGAMAFVIVLQCAAAAAAMITASACGVAPLEVLGFGARILLSLIAVSVPFVALMSFASVLLPHPALGLACALGLQFLLWMVSSLGALVSPALTHVRLAYPTAYRFQLVSDRAADIVTALGHMTGLAIVFVVAGYIVFRWRDL